MTEYKITREEVTPLTSTKGFPFNAIEQPMICGQSVMDDPNRPKISKVEYDKHVIRMPNLKWCGGENPTLDPKMFKDVQILALEKDGSFTLLNNKEEAKS